MSVIIECNVKNDFLHTLCEKWSSETNSRPLFCFLKKVVMILVLLYFGRSSLGHTIKTNFMTFQDVYLEICSILYLTKGPGISFSTTFCTWFFKKRFLMLGQISLPGSLYSLKYWAICVSGNYLFASLWRHKFWN